MNEYVELVFIPTSIELYTISELGKYLLDLHNEYYGSRISCQLLFKNCRYNKIYITSISNNTIGGSYYKFRFTFRFTNSQILLTYSKNIP